jgi:hypothetical protein
VECTAHVYCLVITFLIDAPDPSAHILKISFSKDKGGRTIICHPYLVKKELLVTRNSYRKKRIFALSETNKTRFPA